MAEYIVDFDKHEERRIDWWIAEKGRCEIEEPDGSITERIVRCRDCCFAGDYSRCMHPRFMRCDVEPDGYCAWGEKRSDG